MTLDSVLETLRDEAVFVFPPMACSVELIRFWTVAKKKDKLPCDVLLVCKPRFKTVKVVGCK